ncbi:hypothetical protein JZ751_012689, partial [Albula glossodonta]
ARISWAAKVIPVVILGEAPEQKGEERILIDRGCKVTPMKRSYTWGYVVVVQDLSNSPYSREQKCSGTA